MPDPLYGLSLDQVRALNATRARVATLRNSDADPDAPPADRWPDPAIVLVKNMTSIAQQQWASLVLGSPLTTYADDSQEFQRRAFEGLGSVDTWQLGYKTQTAAVLLQPLEIGEIGSAAIAGVVPVRLMTGNGKFADLHYFSGSGHAYMQVVDTGRFPVLWQESISVGIGIGLVRLDPVTPLPRLTPYIGEIVEGNDSGFHRVALYEALDLSALSVGPITGGAKTVGYIPIFGSAYSGIGPGGMQGVKAVKSLDALTPTDPSDPTTGNHETWTVLIDPAYASGTISMGQAGGTQVLFDPATVPVGTGDYLEAALQALFTAAGYDVTVDSVLVPVGGSGAGAITWHWNDFVSHTPDFGALAQSDWVLGGGSDDSQWPCVNINGFKAIKNRKVIVFRYTSETNPTTINVETRQHGNGVDKRTIFALWVNNRGTANFQYVVANQFGGEYISPWQSTPATTFPDLSLTYAVTGTGTQADPWILTVTSDFAPYTIGSGNYPNGGAWLGVGTPEYWFFDTPFPDPPDTTTVENLSVNLDIVQSKRIGWTNQPPPAPTPPTVYGGGTF